jgi:hypothetical protein
MNFEQLLERELEQALPLQREEGRDWNDVLQRAGFRRRPRRLLAIAAVVVVLGAAPAYAVAPRVLDAFTESGAPEGPPPATIQTSSGRQTIGSPSFSWSTDRNDGSSSVLSANPGEVGCGKGGTPTITVALGERVGFLLEFPPRSVGLSFPEGGDPSPIPLPRQRAVTWRVDRHGFAVLWTSGARGSAQYFVCFERG